MGRDRAAFGWGERCGTRACVAFGRGDTPSFARGGDAQAGDALSAGPPSVLRSIAPHHRITPQSEEAEARPFDGRYTRTNPVAQVQSVADLARCELVMVPEIDFASRQSRMYEKTILKTPSRRSLGMKSGN